jgi:hypothetical protein
MSTVFFQANSGEEKILVRINPAKRQKKYGIVPGISYYRETDFFDIPCEAGQ